jgi:chitinase
MVGAGHPFRPQDKQNFTALLKELREDFNREEATNHRKLYLTIAAGSSDDFIAHTEMEKVAKYVDTVNLMAYDYLEPDSDAVTGHHSPLFHDPADNRNFSTDQSVRAFENAGVPAEKIVLGIPFYGHAWGQVPDVNHGFLQSGKQVPNFQTPYRIISANLLNQGYVRYWDAAASAPYLYNAQTHIFVSYEDPESIAAKGHYVLQNKLAGIMFWEYFGDANGTLLKAVNQSLGLDQTPGAQ